MANFLQIPAFLCIAPSSRNAFLTLSTIFQPYGSSCPEDTTRKPSVVFPTAILPARPGSGPLLRASPSTLMALVFVMVSPAGQGSPSPLGTQQQGSPLRVTHTETQVPDSWRRDEGDLGLSKAPRKPPPSCPCFILVLESFQSADSVPTTPVRGTQSTFHAVTGRERGGREGGCKRTVCGIATGADSGSPWLRRLASCAPGPRAGPCRPPGAGLRAGPQPHWVGRATALPPVP